MFLILIKKKKKTHHNLIQNCLRSIYHVISDKYIKYKADRNERINSQLGGGDTCL